METHLSPNWHHVGAFLGLTFGLTWLLDLAIFMRGGLGIPGIANIQQLQTLLPAFSAIVLGMFFFTDSSLYLGRSAGRGRWFYYFMLVLTILYALSVLTNWLSPAGSVTGLVGAISQILTFLGLLLLVALRFTEGHAAMARAGLTWGKAGYWMIFSLGWIVYYAVQAGLNASLGLGGTQMAPINAQQGLSPGVFLLMSTVQAVLLAPILYIAIFFGEEYGWRGYLQSELIKLGRIRGVLLVGVIWGVWHWPIILMGANYPGHPLLGVLLMTLYSTGNAVVLGYAVLRSGSVLLAAFLHGLIDQVINFIAAIGFRPNDPAFSFGIGIYGITTLLVIVLLIFRDPIWRQRE